MQNTELFARAWTALVMVGLGLFQVLRPEAYASCTLFFRRARASLPAEQSERLQRALEARRDAEGGSSNPTRYAGLLGIAMAPCEFIPSLPFVIPYAVYCLGGAFGMLATYLQVRHATERRTAPLVRRTPFDALSPITIVALLGCFVGVAMLAVYPPFRLGAIGVAISMLIVSWVAWRIAGSQAVLFGDDPQVEYAVDERLRYKRVTAAVALACAPAVVLVGLSVAWFTPGYETLGFTALIVTYAAFAVAMIMTALATRRLRSLSATFANGTSV